MEGRPTVAGNRIKSFNEIKNSARNDFLHFMVAHLHVFELESKKWEEECEIDTINSFFKWNAPPVY